MTRLETTLTSSASNQLVAFTHLAESHRRFVMPGEDQLVFDSMRDYFIWAGALIQKAGGTVIKCMGDGMLLSFPADAADAGAMALRALKSSGDSWLKERQIPCHHLIRAHLGPVIGGLVGAPGQERWDIYGKTVNICAKLESRGLVITPQVFRALSAPLRKYFKKHSAPILYIREEDSHG
jgi:class 3 adenylate cyclase